MQTAGYVPPSPALASLLNANNERNAQAVQTLGRVGGALGSGVVGAVQGAMNPDTFGAGTNPLLAAVRAGGMNFNAAGGAAGGAGGPSNGMARLTNPGGASGAGMNFKQFAAMGKMADATRTMMKESTPTLPGQDEQPVMGMTDDQWQHSGTGAKIQAFSAVKQANDMKQQKLGQMQTMAEIGRTQAQAQDLTAQAGLRQDQADQDAGLGVAVKNLPETGSNPDGSFSMGDWTKALAGAKLAPRVQGAIMGKLLTPPKAAGDSAGVQPKQITLGGKDFIYNPKSGNFSPLDKAGNDLLDTKPKPEEIPPGHMVLQKGNKWTVTQDPSQWETSTRMDPDNPGGVIKTQRFIGKGMGAPAAGGGTAGAPAAASAPPAAAPQTATNPKTGQKLIFQNGQWKPAQ